MSKHLTIARSKSPGYTRYSLTMILQNVKNCETFLVHNSRIYERKSQSLTFRVHYNFKYIGVKKDPVRSYEKLIARIRKLLLIFPPFLQGYQILRAESRGETEETTRK